jgi:hypothetical protein
MTNLFTSTTFPLELSHRLLAANFDIPEVCIFFNLKLYRGNRTKKLDCWGIDAYVKCVGEMIGFFFLLSLHVGDGAGDCDVVVMRLYVLTMMV